MKKIAAVALATFLSACSTTRVDLTVDNKRDGTVSVWIDRPPRDMIDIGTVAQGAPARRHFEAERGRVVTIYVDNLKYVERRITDDDPDPLGLLVEVK